MVDPLTAVSTLRTPQNEKAREDQIPNSAGGHTFAVSGDDRIRRFLILGTEGGTYYSSESELTRENAQIVLAYAQHETRKLVDLAVEISVGGRAPKQNPAIFALAAATALGTEAADRSYALSKLIEVCRTGTHLFLFATYVEQFRGWGRGLRNAVAAWYTEQPLEKVGYQAVKYRSRGGWAHRDLLRLSHPKTGEPGRKALFDWITHGGLSDMTGGALPAIVRDFSSAQRAISARAVVEIIKRGNGLSWEMLPTELLNESTVWEALIDQGMPMTALIRQLPRLTQLGVAKSRKSAIVSRITDQESLRKARIHPVNVLVALKTYASGHSLRGQSYWTPDRAIVDALDSAFYGAFANVEPANKRTLLALDVSGSMSALAGGLPISCIEAEAAISLVTLATEPDVDVVAFSSNGWSVSGLRSRFSWVANGIEELSISPRQRLDDVLRTVNGVPMGGTDCALPMLWAKEHSKSYDTFLVMTDSETWAGSIHPHQALADYRKASGIDSRMIVAAFASNGFTVADPADPLQLDVVGMDSAVPNLIADFSAGRV